MFWRVWIIVAIFLSRRSRLRCLWGKGKRGKRERDDDYDEYTAPSSNTMTFGLGASHLSCLDICQICSRRPLRCDECCPLPVAYRAGWVYWLISSWVCVSHHFSMVQHLDKWLCRNILFVHIVVVVHFVSRILKFEVLGSQSWDFQRMVHGLRRYF